MAQFAQSEIPDALMEGCGADNITARGGLRGAQNPRSAIRQRWTVLPPGIPRAWLLTRTLPWTSQKPSGPQCCHLLTERGRYGGGQPTSLCQVIYKVFSDESGTELPSTTTDYPLEMLE